MIKIEKLDAYRKMKLWINELPEESNNTKIDKIFVYSANKYITWFEGILCLELRISPWATSNYAMLNLNFKKTESSKFQVIYKVCDCDETVKSDIATQDDLIKTGIVKTYYKTLINVFDELNLKNIFPSGELEILGGRYGYIGTSEIAVEIVLNILIGLYALNGFLDNSTIVETILNGCKKK